MWNPEATLYYDGARLWATPEFLNGYGISANYVRKACAMQRQSKANGWRHEQSPLPGVRLLVAYESIPDSTVSKYALPAANGLLNEMQASAKQGKDEQREKLTRAVDWAVEVGWQDWMIHYADETISSRRELAKACAVLKIALDWSKGDYGLRKAIDFYEAFAQEVDRIDLKYLRTRHADRLRRWISKAKKQGIQATVQRPNKGNSHRLKLTAWHRYIITAYYAHPQKFTAPMIAILVSYQCKVHGKENVSESTIRHYVSKREVHALAAPTREGQKAFRDFYLPYVSRSAVMFAGDIWVMDGTRANFAYRTDQGKLAFLDVYMVMDGHSGKVLGFAASENEDRWVVLEALKMAVQFCGHLPAEMLFDNFSAKSTDEVKELMQAVKDMGTQVRYAKVGNARDKIIERGFETWQNVAARWFPNFVGEGVKSRRRNARPAPEWIAEQAKSAPSRDGCLRNIVDAVNLYNETETEGGKKAPGSPRSRFEKSQKPGVIKVEPTQLADLFWSSTLVKMRNARVKIQVRGVKYEYFMDDFEVWKRYDCNVPGRNIQVRVRYDEKDMGSVMLFDPKTNDFLAVAEQWTEIDGSVNMTEGDRKRLMGFQQRVEAWSRKLGHELADLKEEAEKEIATDADLVLVTDVSQVRKEDLKTAESQGFLSYFMDQNGLSITEPVKTERKPWEPQRPKPKTKTQTTGVYGDEGDLNAVDY